MRVLSLAFVYFVTGRLGLLLAIPPGYATAVWMPSGIALACVLLFGGRVWPGVFLGSFAVNVGLGFDPSSAATVARSLAMAGTIALGASLQALVGTKLIRRFVGFPHPLADGKDVLRFLLLGGPASCLINSTPPSVRRRCCWAAPSRRKRTWRTGSPGGWVTRWAWL